VTVKAGVRVNVTDYANDIWCTVKIFLFLVSAMFVMYATSAVKTVLLLWL
jgi:hypothetical protein